MDDPIEVDVEIVWWVWLATLDLGMREGGDKPNSGILFSSIS